MKVAEVIQLYQSSKPFLHLTTELSGEQTSITLRGLKGSSTSLLIASAFKSMKGLHLVIMPDAESAAYLHNDLEGLLEEQNQKFFKKSCLHFPASFKRAYEVESVDSTNVLSRTEVLKRIGSRSNETLIVTYPEAIHEKVVSRKQLMDSTLRLKKGDRIDIDSLYDKLSAEGFAHSDFVLEPGQFSLRGGIIDVFSYSNDYPYRLEFNGDFLESIRSFDPGTQLSVDTLSHISIVPDIQTRRKTESRDQLLSFLPEATVLWVDDLPDIMLRLDHEFQKAEKAWKQLEGNHDEPHPGEIYVRSDVFLRQLLNFRTIEWGSKTLLQGSRIIAFNTEPQAPFHKNFELFFQALAQNQHKGLRNLFLSDNARQYERIRSIMDDVLGDSHHISIEPLMTTLHEGFTDLDTGIALYTDHQIFDRFHRYRLKDRFARKDGFTIKELYQLQQGDYVTHIDHGVGRFDGLEKIENNGRTQEAIRLIYKDGDILYVSIHSLHRIAKYTGKEGIPPRIDKLGSTAWARIKGKTKSKVKDIARDLIRLYARRRATEGFGFSPDTYLQHELEASFIYEDTPDQVKATVDVKADMEAAHPMDRLICGDVGFGKTEIAIRAAFKCVSDSRQVAILVPTTILALQHYKTFNERLKDFPCRIEYISRFRSSAEIKNTLAAAEAGKVDILIGTHRLLSKDVKFKKLGLLIIDEEQKFGVGSKEKIRELKVNVDTLTLTATPIPRTLQFSLLGARDLSVINTPPPNRHPIQTELHGFNEELIRQAIDYELARGGQVFFIHNRVQNIGEVAEVVRRCVPHARIAIGHGQMDGEKLEKVMLDFIEGEYDVLVATTIIESGLDIPNANTMIINEAHHFGLSDLHQLRGRVGRSNRKAFCYLIAPSPLLLTAEARRRLKAIEEFSSLGSGFSIAMRDLDIRGAGNLLGAEQSGFITDIGYEMYQKIINEAISELKEEEFKDLFADKQDTRSLPRECILETDLALHIPDYYVESISERLSLYKELDGLSSDADLELYAQALEDRFGEIPAETKELMNSIRLRKLAQERGFEKLILRNDRMSGYFIRDVASPYYSSDTFRRILEYVKSHPLGVKMREEQDKLSITFMHIRSIREAMQRLETLV
jgi:transcription-repair coupling factor (superfamily II helicase)